MEISTWAKTRAIPRPPPLWLVTDGDVTVGPVNTTLLVRGVLEGSVWDGFYVRDTRGPAWRAVHTVREVRAMNQLIYRKKKPALPHGQATLETLLGLSDDPREIMRIGLELAATRLSADFGLLHCFDDPRKPPVTRFEIGQGPSSRIGDRLTSNDPTARIAKARCLALGEPRGTAELRLAARRLGGDFERVRGVAVAPLAASRGVVGMIELGRADHVFRATDGIILREVAASVVGRLEAIA